MTIPEEHPRYASLMAREALVDGVEEGYVALQGLTAHGRGEAFDYLLGERTVEAAIPGLEAATAAMLAAKRPVISVNGNVAALCPGAVAELQAATGAAVEVNLFHRTDERVTKIERRLTEHGCEAVIGADPDERVPGLESERAKVCSDGIGGADVVLVPLEDGDRTEALAAWGKTVAAIDLNPLSRTARRASITVVDNVVRAMPWMTERARGWHDRSPEELAGLVEGYDHGRNLSGVLEHLSTRLADLGGSPDQLSSI